MNKQKVLAISLGILGMFALALALAYFFTRIIKKPAPQAVFPSEAQIAQCEASLDLFTPQGNMPPQRVCREEAGGSLKILASDKELNGEIRPGDNIIISLNLPGRMAMESWVNVLTGDQVAKPEGNAVLCFVTYPTLIDQDMRGYPNIDEDALNRFYDSRAWSFAPASLFDQALKGGNFVCSRALPPASFTKVSFAMHIPPTDLLSLGRKSSSRMYGVKIVSVPDSFLPGITNESILANYQSFPTIYMLLKPIVRQ